MLPVIEEEALTQTKLSSLTNHKPVGVLDLSLQGPLVKKSVPLINP